MAQNTSSLPWGLILVMTGLIPDTPEDRAGVCVDVYTARLMDRHGNAVLSTNEWRQVQDAQSIGEAVDLVRQVRAATDMREGRISSAQMLQVAGATLPTPLPVPASMRDLQPAPGGMPREQHSQSEYAPQAQPHRVREMQHYVCKGVTYDSQENRFRVYKDEERFFQLLDNTPDLEMQLIAMLEFIRARRGDRSPRAPAPARDRIIVRKRRSGAPDNQPEEE